MKSNPTNHDRTRGSAPRKMAPGVAFPKGVGIPVFDRNRRICP